MATVEQNCQNPATPKGARTVYETLLTCLFWGLRHGESLKLRWQDIDLQLGLLTLVGEHAKNRHEHIVPLSDYMRNRLEALHERRDPSCPYVFPSPVQHKGFRPIGINWLIHQRLTGKLGIPFTPHAARRTFASIGNYLGLPFLTLKRLINHHYQGGITGGYVVQGFDPLQKRKHFQAIADFILEKRNEYLGVEKSAKQSKFEQLKAFAISAGLNPEEVLNGSQLEEQKNLKSQAEPHTQVKVSFNERPSLTRQGPAQK